MTGVTLSFQLLETTIPMGNHQYGDYGDTASDKNNFMDRIFPTDPFNHHVMNREKKIGNNNIVYTIELAFNFFIL